MPALPRPGLAGEDLASDHLRKCGLRVLHRNYRCRGGEIDIVARDGDVLVFVEVKERGTQGHGSAIDAVTALKRSRVLRAARHYAAVHGGFDGPVRFDVIAIDHEPAGTRLRHEKGAFSESA